MLPSGNDAAAVIAYHVAGGEREFAQLMNRRLCDLGLRDSSFINPSGLGRGEFNLASAYDLAQVSRLAMENPVFREIASKRTHTAQGSRTIWMRNLNELVSFYPGADGVKIGWTPGAGNTIVASATRNGHRVIVALLRTPNRAAESAALLDWAFASFAWP
jgi:D-alanyl-D-alanine carboxypeptidase (penicillin-binding protein 5/6)